MDSQIWILSSRQLVASPAWSSHFELENLLVNWCNAKLLIPLAKPNHKYVCKFKQSVVLKVLKKASRLIGDYYEFSDLEIDPTVRNVLMLFDMSPNFISKILSIPGWRDRFDVVVAYVEDCWLLNSFPKFIVEFDYLFIPYSEFQDKLQKFLGIPVLVSPWAFNVLNNGKYFHPRSIDVMSYGRTPKNYQEALFKHLNSANSGYFYYHNISESRQDFPEQSYSPQRYDYLHQQKLRKILKRSKLALAFDFDYTKIHDSLGLNMKKHPSHRCRESILTRRWFEIIASGCTSIGKRPSSEMSNQLFGWEDAMIELPDDPSEGIEFIKDLLADSQRLDRSHKRNYLNSLEKNDWRIRISEILETLDLPLTYQLRNEIDMLRSEALSFRRSVNFSL